MISPQKALRFLTVALGGVGKDSPFFISTGGYCCCCCCMSLSSSSLTRSFSFGRVALMVVSGPTKMVVSAYGRGNYVSPVNNRRRCRTLLPDNPREPLTACCPSRTLPSLQKSRYSLDHTCKCIFIPPYSVHAISWSGVGVVVRG